MTRIRALYLKAKTGSNIYIEEKHCPMIIDIMQSSYRYSKFCKEVGISEICFRDWLGRYPLFNSCYGIGQMLAKESWEEEYDLNYTNPDWDKKAWAAKGARYFTKDAAKIYLDINCFANPWEHYQQIIQQARYGDFSASEIKQLMEAVNVGIRAYEAFKLQEEVNEMKRELTEMSIRNGNNIIPITKAKESN